MDRTVKIAIGIVVVIAIGAVAYYAFSDMMGGQLEEYHVQEVIESEGYDFDSFTDTSFITIADGECHIEVSFRTADGADYVFVGTFDSGTKELIGEPTITPR